MARLYRRTLASPRPSTRLERHAAGGVSEREPGQGRGDRPGRRPRTGVVFAEVFYPPSTAASLTLG
jgi:hypothetical protein